MREERFRIQCPKHFLVGDSGRFEKSPQGKDSDFVVDYAPPEMFEAGIVLQEMGTEGAAWKRCLRARILLRTLSFPEVFQHPVEYMAMERVIRGQGGMIEILGGIVEHPEPPHEAL